MRSTSYAYYLDFFVLDIVNNGVEVQYRILSICGDSAPHLFFWSQMPNYAFPLMKRMKCQHKGPRLIRTWFN